MGERVAAPVDLGEGQRAELVDDRGLVREAVRKRDRARRRAAPPAHERLHELEQAVGPHRPYDTGVDQDLHAAELVRHAGRNAHAFCHLVRTSLDLRLEIVKGALQIARHHRFRHLVRHHPEHPTGGVVGQTQCDACTRVVGLPQPPAQPLVDPGDARPGEVGRLVELDDLDQAADLGRPDAQVHRVAGASAVLGTVVLAPHLRRARHEARIGARVRDQLPDLVRRGVDDRGLLDPHPSTGRRRSAWSAVRVRCIRSRMIS